MNSIIALVVSLVINAAQFSESLFKDYNARKLQEKQLANDKAEKEAQRNHELKKIELNENIYRSHQIIPEARKICLEYIGATEAEISQSSGLPVNFSRQQKSLETKVLLYLPNVGQKIENFREVNGYGLSGGINEFEYEFRNNVIPTIASELENFRLEKQ